VRNTKDVENTARRQFLGGEMLKVMHYLQNKAALVIALIKQKKIFL